MKVELKAKKTKTGLNLEVKRICLKYYISSNKCRSAKIYEIKYHIE